MRDTKTLNSLGIEEIIEVQITVRRQYREEIADVQITETIK